MVSRLLETLDANPASLPQIPQDVSQRRYFGSEIPHRSRMNWSLPAQRLVNFVRACDFYPFLSPWGHPLVRKGECEFGIAKAARTGSPAEARPGTVGLIDGSSIAVACADEWICVRKVYLQNKLVDATEVLRTGECLEHTPAVNAGPRKGTENGGVIFEGN